MLAASFTKVRFFFFFFFFEFKEFMILLMSLVLAFDKVSLSAFILGTLG